MTLRTKPKPVTLLILGAGWTSTFLIPQLRSAGITYAATSMTGREGTIKFVFDPESTDMKPYEALPAARVVLVTFPLKGRGSSGRLVELYGETHGAMDVKFIQLGSTGIFAAPHWNDADSPYDETNDRAVAEDELMRLGGCVLNLAGLYGGSRIPKGWLGRVAKTKEQLKGKGALHLIHGEDVAGAILGVVRSVIDGKEVGEERGFTSGKRWLLTDLHVYDWWELAWEWGGEEGEGQDERMAKEKAEQKGEKLEYRKWVLELMEEEGVRALPRDVNRLGRVLDSRAFWKRFGIWPSQGRVK